jgi:predicted nucleotidyltransferase
MFLASQRDMLVMLTESDIDLYIRTLVMLVMLTESDIDLYIRTLVFPLKYFYTYKKHILLFLLNRHVLL